MNHDELIARLEDHESYTAHDYAVVCQSAAAALRELVRERDELRARLERIDRLADMIRDPRQWIQTEHTQRISRELDAARSGKP